MDETLWCYHSSETSFAEILHSAIFFLEFYKNDCFFVKFYIGQYMEEKGSDGLEYSVTSNNDRLS